MLLCQITTIALIVYAAINSVITYRINRKVNNSNGETQKKNEQHISKAAE